MKNIINNKKFALNNQGYTLIEALMSLFIFAIVIVSLLNFLNVTKTNLDNNYNFKEVSLFFSQIQEDFLESKKIKVKSSQELILNNYLNEEIEYKYDRNRLIRQKNHKGYEIMLNNVQSLEFYTKKHLLHLKIKFKNLKENYDWVLNNV
ncbi:MAG: competence type IV pilus minor pilin ComGF [Mycoplasmatales bacterium]